MAKFIDVTILGRSGGKTAALINLEEIGLFKGVDDKRHPDAQTDIMQKDGTGFEVEESIDVIRERIKDANQ